MSMKLIKRVLGVIVLLLLSVSSKAEDPIYIPDVNLRIQLTSAFGEKGLAILNPRPSDMLILTDFTGWRANISDLTGLEYATNLTTLRL